ncbi:hypothetical protein BD311DRAFT_732516 [Dichomitus squalens]|uniref:Uncharacterized protein n=1 Tax=Dichomitus squalens TaxID=114155 RepID=A0A4Q9M710_9APHY|nr:hypothetical protein BD311DRAFT_732516 [Dichomitus squalens]
MYESLIALALEWYGRSSFSPRWLGKWRLMFFYIFLSLWYEFISWRVPQLVGAVVAISFVGSFLGLMFPIVMNDAGRILDIGFGSARGGVAVRHRGNIG